MELSNDISFGSLFFWKMVKKPKILFETSLDGLICPSVYILMQVGEGGLQKIEKNALKFLSDMGFRILNYIVCHYQCFMTMYHLRTSKNEKRKKITNIL